MRQRDESRATTDDWSSSVRSSEARVARHSQQDRKRYSRCVARHSRRDHAPARALPGWSTPRRRACVAWRRVAGEACVCGLPSVYGGLCGCLTFVAPDARRCERRALSGASTELAKNSPETQPESLTSFRATNPQSERGNRSPWKCSPSAESRNAPERIRTSDLRFRRRYLYRPAMPVPTRNCLHRRVYRGDTSGHERTREDAIRSHLVPTPAPVAARRRRREPTSAACPEAAGRRDR
jgi:hypothetical protein